MNRRKIVQVVLQAFDRASDKHCRIRANMFTGGSYVSGEDFAIRQTILAVRVIEATIEFQRLGIPDAPDFPWGYQEREALKGKACLDHIVALWARSLEAQNYRMDTHPAFRDYASGVLADPWLSGILQYMYPGAALDFLPRPLPGLDASGYYKPSRKDPHRPHNSSMSQIGYRRWPVVTA